MTAATVLSESAPFDLCLSENPFPPLPSVLRALNQVMAQANRYPEFLPDRLPTLIADRIGTSVSQIVAGSGATGVALQIMQAVLRPGDNMVFAAPTFDGYPIMADIVGAKAITVPLDSSGRQDLGALAAMIDERTRLAIVCRPHNPTGTVVAASELHAFLHAVPREVSVILDEAYVEFLGGAHGIDALNLVVRYPNVLVLRTFSKAFGLAGLRIGYAIASPRLAATVRRLQLPFGINSVAVAAVAASYAAERELRVRVARITHERELLRNALRGLGLAVPRSHANFLYLPGPGVAGRLTQAGIAAKTYPDGSARIAVGDPAAGAAVLGAFTRDS
jgi:histidinol-phosphate aminotransferase